MEWEPWPEFLREQLEALAQTEENLARWKKAHKAALRRNDPAEAKRLERLIDLSGRDMAAMAGAVKHLMRGRDENADRHHETGAGVV